MICIELFLHEDSNNFAKISILAFEIGCLTVCLIFPGVEVEALGDAHAWWKRLVSYSYSRVSSVHFDFPLFTTCVAKSLTSRCPLVVKDPRKSQGEKGVYGSQ